MRRRRRRRRSRCVLCMTYLDDAHGVGDGVGDGRGAEADDGVAAELHLEVVRLGERLLSRAHAPKKRGGGTMMCE